MKRLFLVIGCAALAACGSDESSLVSSPPTTVALPWSAPITTAVPGDTTTPPPPEPSTSASVSTTQPPTSPPPDSTSTTAAPAVGAGPTRGTAVVYASHGDDYEWLPVGWWDGAAWGSVEWPGPDAVIPATTFDMLSVSSVELESGPLQGVSDFTVSSYGCIDDAGLVTIKFDPGLPERTDYWGYRAVAVTGDWDVQPRPVRAVGLDAPEYQELGESLVPTADPVDPTLGDVVQVLRADLDGDGIEEVLFNFEHASPVTTGAGTEGDFALVVVRYPDAAGGVVDDVLFEHVVPTPMEYPSPGRARIAAISDLNGDGTMEVVISFTFWESGGVTVHEFRDGELQEVMSSGCGV